MNVTPRQLRAFLSLAQSLNFSRTAEEFFITQPSLSKMVRDLEDELGLRLFHRSTRSVKLTDEGARLLPLARQLVGGFDNGLAAMKRQAVGEAHKIAIGALPSLASVLLPAAVSELEREVPGLVVTIYDGSAEATIRRLVNYQVEFAVAAADPSKPELQYEEILRDRFVLLAGGDLRKRVRRVMKMSELTSLPLISMTDASTAMKYMSAAFLQRDTVFRPKMQFDQVGTIGGFVLEGVGIAALPYLGVLPLLAHGPFKLAEIEDGPVRSVGIITRRSGRLSQMSERAVAHLRHSARQLVQRAPAWLSGPSA